MAKFLYHKKDSYQFISLVLSIVLLLLIGCQAEQETQTTVDDGLDVAITAEVSEPTDTPRPVETPTDEATNTNTPEIITTTEESMLNEGQADADVEFVRALQENDGTWTFHVTVRHPDTGWEDYADGWDVLLPDGTVLKPAPTDPFTRLLLHPHENEQPFTRSQRGIVIPDGITQVRVRAHDLVDGFGGREVVVDLSVEEGQGFEVARQK